MSNTLSVGGHMSSYVNCLGGRCPHMPFFIGGHMSRGENVLHSTDIGPLGLFGRTFRRMDKLNIFFCTD